MDAWLVADRKFHRFLYEIADNSKIDQIMSTLDMQWQRMRLGMYTLEGRMQRAYEEHLAITEAIIAGDPQEASRLIRLHVEKVKDELVKLFKMFHYPIV